MGVSLCLLVRDDAATVGPLLAKLRPHVTEIVVVDTGSIDSSPSICKPYADKWVTYLGCNSPEDEKIEDFANARQYALELATHEWHLWADADDDILGAETIPQLINRPERAVQYLVPYEYTHDAAGRVTCLHWRENLVKPRDQLKWQIPVHEVLIPGCPMDVITPAPSLRRIHKKHLSKKAPDPDRNLRILTKYIARVGETDVRSLYYYGVELRNHGRTGDAIRVLRRYVELSGGPNGWHDERCLAMLELARIYHYLQNDQQEAVRWATEAMLTKSWPEPYFLLARAFWTMAGQGIAEEHNVRRALHWAEHGLRTPDASTVLFVNPMERFEIQHIVNAAYVRHGRIEDALKSVRAGLEGMPEDVEFQKRALVYENHLTKNTVLRETQKLRSGAEQLMALGAFDQPDWQGFATTVAQLLGIPLPGPTAATVREVPPQPIDDGCLDLVFFLGEAYERWNPVTLAAGGMGGSETMAWELARRLRALGHRVRVFADCAPEQEGVFDGVEWLHFGKYPGTTCDVLIASRRPDVVDDGAGLKAGARWLWIHDVHVSDALTQARAYRFDRVLALSEWHKAYLLGIYNVAQPALVAHLRPEDITVTRNGIDLTRFEADGPRNPKRVVYSSSPDRGLTTLLEMWPEILEAEPEAELQILYGWDNWEKSVAMGLRTDIPWMSPEALRRIKLQVRTIPRVTMRGRISGEALAREFLMSGVMAAPHWFTETFGIVFAEAQAAGMFIVTTPVAALNETVADRGVRVPGGWDAPQGPTAAERKAFVDAVVRAIRGEDQPKTRDELRAYARERFGLDELAKDWDVMLRETLADVGELVTPRFRP